MLVRMKAATMKGRRNQNEQSTEDRGCRWTRSHLGWEKEIAVGKSNSVMRIFSRESILQDFPRVEHCL